LGVLYSKTGDREQSEGMAPDMVTRKWKKEGTETWTAGLMYPPPRSSFFENYNDKLDLIKIIQMKVEIWLRKLLNGQFG